MLTRQEVGQYHAYGFVVIRDCLSGAEVERIGAAHRKAIDAKATADGRFGDGGTVNYGNFVEDDDAFSALVEHPKLMEAMRDIDGTEFLYMGGSDIWENRDDTPWHCDQIPGSKVWTAKAAVYLDEAHEDDGALNAIPGTHIPEFNAAIMRSWGRFKGGGSPRLWLEPKEVPGAVSVQTSPGDVVLFQTNLWHSAWRRVDGQPRRNLFIQYFRDPGDDVLALRELRQAVTGALSEERPYLYSAAMMAKGGAPREKMASRLEHLGVDNVRER
jgi:hypothetical protein